MNTEYNAGLCFLCLGNEIHTILDTYHCEYIPLWIHTILAEKGQGSVYHRIYSWELSALSRTPIVYVRFCFKAVSILAAKRIVL